jgi:YfiH family protein
MRSRLFWGNRHDPLGGFPKELWETMRPRWKQVHGVGVVEVSVPGQECGEVDGLWTRRPDLPIGIVTADCVPILLEHAQGMARAALHAGWRGVFARIPEVFFRALPPELADPGDWRVVLGPSIRACCYEVSSELTDSFCREFPDLPRGILEPEARRLDLVAVLRHQLGALGVPDPDCVPACTFCTASSGQALYQSYRRGDRHSRQLSIIL